RRRERHEQHDEHGTALPEPHGREDSSTPPAQTTGGRPRRRAPRSFADVPGPRHAQRSASRREVTHVASARIPLSSSVVRFAMSAPPSSTRPPATLEDLAEENARLTAELAQKNRQISFLT